jgi:hypothetical protein
MGASANLSHSVASHLLEDGARFPIGRRLCQLQAMGGIGDVLLSFVD